MIGMVPHWVPNSFHQVWQGSYQNHAAEDILPGLEHAGAEYPWKIAMEIGAPQTNPAMENG